MDITIKDKDVKVNVKIISDADSKGKAIATLALGPFKIKGFRIMESEYPNETGEYLWVAPPAYRSKTGKFHKEFWCDDKEIWKEIQRKILAKFNEGIMKKELKKDDIPIIEE